MEYRSPPRAAARTIATSDVRAEAERDAWPLIEVLLATCDGALYLAELLDSLFAQTVPFRLVVADDASQDGTVAIIDRYVRAYPGRITVLPANVRRLGPVLNFAYLFDHATADYVLPCDQDDVWLPRKIEISLAAMRDAEAGVPVLVHTDLTVVGPDLALLGRSMFAYCNIDPYRTDVGALLLVNVATGCASMVNRSLYRLARPIPADANMHDHWVAILASAFGIIRHVPESTILYRQHGGNVLGAQSAANATTRSRLVIYLNNRKNVLLRRCSRQAAAMLRRHGPELSPTHRTSIETVANLWRIGFWDRFRYLRRNGFAGNGAARQLALLMTLMRRPPPA